MVTLILCSTLDDASMNLAHSLIQSTDWGDMEEYPHGRVRNHPRMPVQILEIDQLHIHAEGIDHAHTVETGEEIDEILVLSRHVSSSNTPAITLHAIGLPGETPLGAPGIAGGERGFVVPPSPRFSSLYRKMLELARDEGLHEEFDLTIETTHHGPKLESPSLYIEIGSTELEWNRKDVAAVWAMVFANDEDGLMDGFVHCLVLVLIRLLAWMGKLPKSLFVSLRCAFRLLCPCNSR